MYREPEFPYILCSYPPRNPQRGSVLPTLRPGPIDKTQGYAIESCNRVIDRYIILLRRVQTVDEIQSLVFSFLFLETKVNLFCLKGSGRRKGKTFRV